MLIKLGFSKTYYRGMGSEFVTDVKNHGLPKGTSITSSKTIAKEYAEKGALNNLEGDPQIGYKTNSKIKAQVKKLRRLGVSKRTSRLQAPWTIKPKGAIIKLKIPDKLENTLNLGLGHLKEKVLTTNIPKKFISIQEDNIAAPKGEFPASVRRFTRKQLRISEAAANKGRKKEVVSLLESAATNHPVPLLDKKKQLRQSRIFRKQLTKKLIKLL